VHQLGSATWLAKGQSLSSPMKYLASSCRPRCKGKRQCTWQTGTNLCNPPSACIYILARTLGRKRNKFCANGSSGGTDGCAQGVDKKTVGAGTRRMGAKTKCHWPCRLDLLYCRLAYWHFLVVIFIVAQNKASPRLQPRASSRPIYLKDCLEEL
jgi:hypothetical protein